MSPHTWALLALALVVLALGISHVQTSRNVRFLFQLLTLASAGDLADVRQLLANLSKGQKK